MIGDTGADNQQICAGPARAQLQDPAQGDDPSRVPPAGTQRRYQIGAASQELAIPVGQGVDDFGDGQGPVHVGRRAGGGVDGPAGPAGEVGWSCHDHVAHLVRADDS